MVELYLILLHNNKSKNFIMKKKLFIIALFVFPLIITTKSVEAQDEVPILQYFNTTLHRHILTCNPSEITPGKNGWVVDNSGNLGRLIIGTISLGDPVYRFDQPSSGAHYCTLHENVYPDGFVLDGIMAYEEASVEAQPTEPVYEYYNTGDYFYSTSGAGVPGYHLNGISFYCLLP
jgi:hypothetical protein